MILKCYPVCECGEVIKNLTSYTTLEKISGNYSKEVRHFEPKVCPKCKEVIETIQITNPTWGGRIVFK